jgi:cytochrome c5
MNKFNLVNLASLKSAKDKAMKKGQPSRTLVILIACLVMLAVLVSCQSNPSQPTQAPAAAGGAPALTDGATLLDTRCSVCHSADRPKQAKKTRDQWDQTVTRMIGKGAQLTDAEKVVLVDYLAKTYGP